jgi:organic radical activating enzyme
MCKLSKFTGKINHNLKNNSASEWFNSEYMNYVRTSMLNNEKLAECHDCWKDEDNNHKSLRQIGNKEYGIYITKNLPEQLKHQNILNLNFPIDWELQITNLCNLSCHMCHSFSSSKLLTENKKLFNEQYNQKDYDLNEFALNELENIFKSDTRIINLRGGEPFIIPKITKFLEQSVNEKISSNIDLHITTNGTYLSEKLLDILSKFKSVKIMFSLESIGNVNEYIRYPSSWETIKQNYNQLKNLPNVSIIVNSTIQNLNILYFKDLVNWCNENKIWLTWSVLKEPTHLQIDNLPVELKKLAFNNLKDIEIVNGTSLTSLKEYILKISEDKPDEELWNKFIHITKARDQFRKTNIKDSLPEIGKYF